MYFVSTMNDALSKTAHNSKRLIVSKIKVIKKRCLKVFNRKPHRKISMI